MPAQEHVQKPGETAGGHAAASLATCQMSPWPQPGRLTVLHSDHRTQLGMKGSSLYITHECETTSGVTGVWLCSSAAEVDKLFSNFSAPQILEDDGKGRQPVHNVTFTVYLDCSALDCGKTAGQPLLAPMQLTKAGISADIHLGQRCIRTCTCDYKGLRCIDRLGYVKVGHAVSRRVCWNFGVICPLCSKPLCCSSAP